MNPFSVQEIMRRGRYFSGAKQLTRKGKKNLQMHQQKVDNIINNLEKKEAQLANAQSNASKNKIQGEIKELENELTDSYFGTIQNIQDREKFSNLTKAPAAALGAAGLYLLGKQIAKRSKGRGAMSMKDRLRQAGMYGAGVASPVAMMSGLAYYGGGMNKKANARETLIKIASMDKEANKKKMGFLAALGLGSTLVATQPKISKKVTNNPVIQNLMHSARSGSSDLDAVRAHHMYKSEGGKGGLFSPQYDSETRLQYNMRQQRANKAALKRARESGRDVDSFRDLNIVEQEKFLYPSKKSKRGIK